MLTAIYRRVSTDHQDNSLEVQEQKVFAYIQLKGLTTTPDLHYSDPDTSGSIPFADRPGSRRLLNRIQQNPRLIPADRISHLIIAKLDRLGRSAQDVLTTFKTLDALGIALHIVDMGGDSLSTNGPAGRLMLTVMAGMAEFEREMIRTRIQETLDHKFQQGHLIGTVPYGFDVVLQPNGTKTLIGIPDQQQWIHKMHQWRQSGMSYYAIAHQLNIMRVPTKIPKGTIIKVKGNLTKPSAGKWRSTTVETILNSKHTQHLLNPNS